MLRIEETVTRAFIRSMSSNWSRYSGEYWLARCEIGNNEIQYHPVQLDHLANTCLFDTVDESIDRLIIDNYRTVVFSCKNQFTASRDMAISERTLRTSTQLQRYVHLSQSSTRLSNNRVILS